MALELRFNWVASPSADTNHYHIRHSDGAESVNVNKTPDAETATTSWVLWLPDETTGTWVVLVRGVDADGKEEAGLACCARVRLEAGVVVESFPAEPELVRATPSAGGKVTVRWLYRPAHEVGGPGVAAEGRIYCDGGEGPVGFGVPLGVVDMGNPTATAWFEWTSEALVDDTEYGFTVRIATAAWPAGSETQNGDVHHATPDSDVPETPDLSAEVV